MVEYVWMSPWGEEWNLTTGSHGVHMEQGGAENLPRSRAREQGVPVVGVPGERPTGLVIPRAEGSVTVACFAHGARTASEVASQFRAAFSHHKPGSLVVRGWSQGDLSMSCHLVGFSAPTRQDKHGSFVRIAVDLSGPGGLWEQSYSARGEVSITNTGDAPVSPRVRWQEGGDLVMPSGATTTLPTVPEPRTLILDAAESCVVLDDDGQPDNQLWGSFPVYPESVPVGEARTYVAPEGAALSWAIGYLEPWK